MEEDARRAAAARAGAYADLGGRALTATHRRDTTAPDAGRGRHLRAGDDAAPELAAAAVLLAVADLGVRVGPRVANLLRPLGEGELVERVADAIEGARGPARRVFHSRGADLAREHAKLAGRLAEREERFGRHVLEDQHQELSEQQ